MDRKRSFSAEEVGLIQESERRMDGGELQFVVCPRGQRWAFPDDVMDECGIESGEAVTDVVLHAMMEINLRKLQAEIIARDAARASDRR